MTTDRTTYPWRPLLLNATEAHRSGQITYDAQGTIHLRCQQLEGPVTIGTERQFPCVLPTLLSLDKALSSSANSPRLRAGTTLREAFDAEYQRYLELVAAPRAPSQWEPDYGTYVYDRRTGDLYLVAPEPLHRLALVTSNAKLTTDPAGQMTSEEIRDRLAGTVVGFVGASVGSNMIEGVLREMRPRVAKVADPDYLEVTNLNRLVHGSLRYLTHARAQRHDPRNAFETRFVNKVDLLAYENQLVDPYMDWFLYPEGVTGDNLDAFLLGAGGEPRLDYVVEEADDPRIKIEVRKRARAHGIPVLMASDLGHRSQVQMQDYAAHPALPLGFRIDDSELLARLERCMSSGRREDLFALAAGLMGDGFAVDEQRDWVEQRGEQPTSSVPQSGSVALLSGALGGKLLALHRLGHPLPERLIVDARRMRMTVDDVGGPAAGASKP